MKHKVSELEGGLLDAAVAKAEGEAFRIYGGQCDVPVYFSGRDSGPTGEWETYDPSAAWDCGGPIIERERINLNFGGGKERSWMAAISPAGRYTTIVFGQHPLSAAMRAYVASKFGDGLDLP